RRRATPALPGRRDRPIVSRQRGCLKVVVLISGDTRAHKVARLRPSTPLEIRDAVHIISLPLHASYLDAIFVFQSVYEHLDVASHKPRQPLGRNHTLYLDDLLETISLDAVFYVVFVLHRARAEIGRAHV